MTSSDLEKRDAKGPFAGGSPHIRALVQFALKQSNLAGQRNNVVRDILLNLG